MSKPSEHLLHARALRDDLFAAATVWVPRRDVIMDWLDGFARRAEAPAYLLGETEEEDLRALDTFLRKKKVPMAVR